MAWVTRKWLILRGDAEGTVVWVVAGNCRYLDVPVRCDDGGKRSVRYDTLDENDVLDVTEALR